MIAISHGIAAASSNGAPANSASAQAYFDRLVPYPTSAREVILSAFIDGLVAAGLSNHFDFLAINCAVNAGTSLTSVFGELQGVYVYTSGPAIVFTTDQGWSNGGYGKHINSQFNPSTAISPKYVQNDAMVFFHSSITTQINQLDIYAATPAAPSSQLSNLTLYPRWSDNKTYFCVNGVEVGVTYSGESSGLFMAQRTASNLSKLYRNNAEIASSSGASNAVPNGEIRFSCHHNTRLMGIGKSMDSTQRTAFQTLCNNLITSITGGLP